MLKTTKEPKELKTMNQSELMELKSVVRRTMEEQMEMYSEVWLTGDQLCQVFGTFTKS